MTKCAGCKITFSTYDAYVMHNCSDRLSIPHQILHDYGVGQVIDQTGFVTIPEATPTDWSTAHKQMAEQSKLDEPAIRALYEKPVVGIKHDQEKPDMSLISSIAITKVAEVMTYGKKKYSAHNWRAGLAWSRVLSASLRHIFAYIGGESLDPETGKSHIAHAVCCLLMVLEFEETKRDFDDRFTQPNKEPK